MDDWIDEARKQRVINEINEKRSFRKETINHLLDALNCNDRAMENGEISICQWVLMEKYIKFSIKLINENDGQCKWFLSEMKRTMVFV